MKTAFFPLSSKPCTRIYASRDFSGSPGPHKAANGLTWQIVGGDSLRIALRSKSQSVFGVPGSLIYLRGAISLPETKTQGLFGKLFAGEDIFANYFHGTDDKKDGIVAFGHSLPGTVVGIELKQGESIKFNHHCLIAYTPDVEISGKLNWAGFIPFGQNESVVLPSATGKEDQGMVWLCSYGNYELHQLEKGEKLIIDNGCLLAFDGNVNYKVVPLGNSLGSLVFGREGFGMEFTGPCKVYTQSRSADDLVAAIGAKLPADKK